MLHKSTRITKDSPFFIVAYPQGGYIQPTPEAKAAFERIRSLLLTIKAADLKAIREWHGNLVLYGMNSKVHTPVVTQDIHDKCVEHAKGLHPDATFDSVWTHSDQGVIGVSVRMQGPMNTNSVGVPA